MNVINKYDWLSIGCTVAFFILRFSLIAMKVEFNIFYFVLSLYAIMSMWTIKHNFIHAAFFQSKRANYILGRCFAVFTCSSVYSTRINHLVNHHVENDALTDWTSLKRAKSFKWEFMRLATYPFVVLPILIKGKNEYVKASSNNKMKTEIKVDNVLILLLLFVCMIYSPLSTIYYLLLPVLFGHWFLLVTNYLQHRSCDNTSKFNHSNNYVGPLYNALFFNVGYHAAHHNYPNAHWSELSGIHVQKIVPYNSTNYNKSNFIKSWLFDYLFKINS